MKQMKQKCTPQPNILSLTNTRSHGGGYILNADKNNRVSHSFKVLQVVSIDSKLKNRRSNEVEIDGWANKTGLRGPVFSV